MKNHLLNRIIDYYQQPSEEKANALVELAEFEGILLKHAPADNVFIGRTEPGGQLVIISLVNVGKNKHALFSAEISK